MSVRLSVGYLAQMHTLCHNPFILHNIHCRGYMNNHDSDCDDAATTFRTFRTSHSPSINHQVMHGLFHQTDVRPVLTTRV